MSVLIKMKMIGIINVSSCDIIELTTLFAEVKYGLHRIDNSFQPGGIDLTTFLQVVKSNVR